MKKIIILCFFLCIKTIFTDQERERFLKANALYEQGKALEALSLYNVLEKKYPSVWFNEGLCYYAVGKYPQALVSFRQAQRKANKRLLKKIDPMLKRVQDNLQQPHDGLWYNFFLYSGSLEPFLLIQILFLLCFGFSIFFLFFKKIYFFFRLFLIGGLLAFGFLCIVHYWIDNQRIGVIIKDKVTLSAGPHKEFHGIVDLCAGQEIKVVEQDQSWYKVDFHGVQGWIEKSKFERII